MIKYIARYDFAKIQKIEIFKESKDYIWLKSDFKIEKNTKDYSPYNSFDEAKRALLNRLVAKIHKHEYKVDSYQDLLVKVNDIIEEDIN